MLISDISFFFLFSNLCSIKAYKVNECVMPQRRNALLKQFFGGGKLEG